ncbi:MAG TPA: hypothetical protein VE111_22855 [Bradyrhizobium sp.]|nr:hypothetical protein [Bradyrhizobium sp.]
MFSLLGPALGIASAALIDLLAGKRLEFDEGTILAFMFSLGVSIVTGPVDGYLAHFIPQLLRAPLSAVVGAATAAFLLLGITRQAIPHQALMNIALSGAVCMGLCSLLSGPSRDELR